MAGAAISESPSLDAPETDGVGFDERVKTSQKCDSSTAATQNTTQLPAEVAHAVRVMSVIGRLATMSPEMIAALYILFNDPVPDR